MSLLFNMLSSLVITFLPRGKCLLLSWLQSPSAVILEPPKIKSVTVSTVSRSICHEVMGPDAMILVFWMLSFKPTFSLSSHFQEARWSRTIFTSLYVHMCTCTQTHILQTGWLWAALPHPSCLEDPRQLPLRNLRVSFTKISKYCELIQDIVLNQRLGVTGKEWRVGADNAKAPGGKDSIKTKNSPWEVPLRPPGRV